MAVPAQPVPTEDRVAALERQVAALSGELTAQRYDRRALLRRTGAALVAGAAGVSGVIALPTVASAGEGDPLLLGRPNEAGAGPTGLTGAGSGPTLQLGNPTASGSGVAPSLRLSPGSSGGGLDPAGAQAGDLASSGELLWYSHTSAGPGGSATTGAVYTSAFANHLEFLTEPRRVLDTRPGVATDGNGSPNDRRTRVVAGPFDAAGRLRAGRALVLDLSGLIVGGAGVFANLTVVSPAGAGFLTAYPTPDADPRTDGLDRPATSSLNFSHGTAALANFALVRLGFGNRISIFTTTEAHVLLDLTAVSVLEPFSLRQGGASLRRFAP